MIKRVPIETILQIRQEVMYPDLTIEDVRLEDDNDGEHLGLFNDSKLVTIVSIFRKDNQLQFRKLATLLGEQGKGYAKEMMRHIMEIAVREGMQSVWCNARVQVAAFYHQFGMKETGKSWWKHDIEFIKMERNLT